MERIPGGMVLLPLCCGATIATFFPGLPARFGSFTEGLFTGAIPILAVYYVCVGSTISLRTIPRVLTTGGALLAAKFLLGAAAATLLGHWLGTQPVQHGWLAGLSTLAVVAAVNDTNGGLYLALLSQYGLTEDAGAYAVMAIESGPFLTMLTLGAAGISGFPWQTLLGAVLPLAIGMALGNLDGELRALLRPGVPLLIPFFSFALGARLDLREVARAGLPGLALGLAVLAISAAALYGANRLTGGDGVAGVAASATAGNAAATPMLVAAANPVWRDAAVHATTLVAACVLVTALLTPLLTAWVRRSAART